MSSPPHIVVIRHGERADKYADLVPHNEPHNPALTESGFRQAEGVANILAQQFESPQHVERWQVVASPFLRTIQTATAIMKALGPQRHTGHLDIDFEVGEHIKCQETPAGIRDLTEEKAQQEIVARWHPRSETATEASPPPPPCVRFSFGDASLIKPNEGLDVAGDRFMRAVKRIYKNHLAHYYASAPQLPPPSIIVVSHGFAPAQLFQKIYGEHLRVSRVYLCSMLHLVPAFNDDHDDHDDEGEKNNREANGQERDAAAAAADAADDEEEVDESDFARASGVQVMSLSKSSPAVPASPFRVGWSRGISWFWRNPVDTRQMKSVGNFELTEAEHSETVDKTWYESRICNECPKSFHLAYHVKPDAPPQL